MDLDSFLAWTNRFSAGFLNLLFTTIAVVVGVWCVASACRKIVAEASGLRQGQPLAMPVLIDLFVAMCMLQLANFSNDLSTMLTGGDVQQPANALSYLPATISNSSFWRKVALAVVSWMAMIGGAAIFRGLLLWKQMAEGHWAQSGDYGWRGFLHIIGGAILLNVGGLFS